MSLWKDPLSFCFHVEGRQAGSDDWSPRGFVFGSFGIVVRKPAVLLNGVYLRRQHGALRAAVLDAIEEAFCRPLGIRWVGIANRHGGYGELPRSYVRRPLCFERWRALAVESRRPGRRCGRLSPEGDVPDEPHFMARPCRRR